MDPKQLLELLRQVASGDLAVDVAAQRLADLPYSDLGFAKLDLHRELRAGHPEAVYAEGKRPEDLVAIAERFVEKVGRVLVTRVDAERAAVLADRFPEGRFHERARIWTLGAYDAHENRARVAVVAAGTSDLPVSEEAAVCLEWLGHEVERVHDVGVAGLHRLLAHLPVLRESRLVIAVAGMDGALPTLVAGLVSAPVIAVPTSVGYGAAFSGIAPLLTMLNACAPGVSVVNIDNGFGAAMTALRILRTVPGTGSGVAPGQESR